MSADNALFVKKEDDGWYVWMGFMSDAHLYSVPADACWYSTEQRALQEAIKKSQKEYIEYGIQMIPERNKT